MSDLNTLLQKHQDEINALQKRMVEDFNALIKASMDAFFEKYPRVRAIAWTQYTPYFNDGDACEFSVHEPAVLVYTAGTGVDDESQLDDLSDTSPYDGYDSWNIRSELKKEKSDPDTDWFTMEFHDDFMTLVKFTDNETLMENLFGDHATVYLTREGPVVVEYDHD